MTRVIQLHLDDSYRLDIVEDEDGLHTMTLMEYSEKCKGYGIVSDIRVYETQEMFDLLYDAYRGDYSIWTNQYEVVLDNDNQPMLNLVVDNDDWPEDRADD